MHFDGPILIIIGLGIRLKSLKSPNPGITKFRRRGIVHVDDHPGSSHLTYVIVMSYILLPHTF